MYTKNLLKHHPFFLCRPIASLEKYCASYTSPAYLYAKEVITWQYELLKKSLPASFKISYAVKSNPNKNILKHICDFGIGCDIASRGELKLALAAGFKPQNIMFTGPGKTPAEIRDAINNKILSLSVESLQELDIIDEIAGDLGVKQTILVRINPLYAAGEFTKIIGGSGVSKFGIDIEQMESFFHALKTKRHVVLRGIHIFNSSQILAWKKIFASTKNVITTAKTLGKKYQFNFSYIDLGGGFGIPYSQKERELNVPALGLALKQLINHNTHANLVLELGRFLTGFAGIYLTKVLYTKTSQGTNIAIVDGGLNHLARPILIGQKHPIINLTGLLADRSGIEKYMVAGPLCTALDCFDQAAELCITKPGDILAILNVGAYGFTESMPLFLSHPVARELVID
ncbi:diaminopimelate decarboxylase [Gammaproteobacteria bacterium]